MATEAQRGCWRCNATVGAALVCPRCAAPQPLSAGGDLFAVLGFERRLTIEPAALEERSQAAARAVHPDRYQTAGEQERALSLAASAAVNRAYRTLRDPVARGRYWLELHGTPLGERNAEVPPGLVADVFETQEKLAELRTADGADAEALRAEVRALHRTLADRLEARRDDLVREYEGWNGHAATAALTELKRRLAEIAYLRTLQGDVEDALGEGLRGTNHRH